MTTDQFPYCDTCGLRPDNCDCAEGVLKLKAAGYGGFTVNGKLDPRYTFRHALRGLQKHYATCSEDLADIPLTRDCPLHCRFCAKREEKLLNLKLMMSIVPKAD